MPHPSSPLMRLAGLDVGFSERRRSSGVGVLIDGRLQTARHHAVDVADTLLSHAPFTCLAIDGPLLPRIAPPDKLRLVEQALAGGHFQRRCKAAFSHVPGTGRQLREHAGHAADRMAESAAGPLSCPSVRGGAGIVEAFPNAFLGLCLDDAAYAAQPLLPRGRKFDWLYEQWIDARLAIRLIDRIGLPVVLADAMVATRDHDERAAVICLMTAFCAASGQFAALGEPDGGWIVLPPPAVWAGWARQATEAALRRLPGLQMVTA